MSSRLVAVSLATVLLLGALVGPALAVEDGGFPEPNPPISEVGSGSETSAQFRPEPAEPPAFFDALLFPILGASVVLAVLIGMLYLLWQPRFSKEREQSGRR